MYLSRKGKFIRTDMWREGDYLDLWSVPHFLSGTLVGFGFYLSGLGFAPSFFISILLLIVYEMFEVIIEIKETRMNRILDVVVGMGSFTLAFVGASSISTVTLLATFATVGIADLGLSTFGWMASHKAATLERKLRAEFEEQKQRLRARRGLLRRRIHAGKYEWRMRRMRRQLRRLSPQTGVVQSRGRSGLSA